MAVKKKSNKYSVMALEELKKMADELSAYIKANPHNKLKDRFSTQTGKSILTASVEDQSKNLRESMKDYALIIAQIKELEVTEEVTESQIQVRGDQDLTPFEEGSI